VLEGASRGECVGDRDGERDEGEVRVRRVGVRRLDDDAAPASESELRREPLCRAVLSEKRRAGRSELLPPVAGEESAARVGVRVPLVRVGVRLDARVGVRRVGVVRAEVEATEEEEEEEERRKERVGV